jgi:hypothetical protein
MHRFFIGAMFVMFLLARSARADDQADARGIIDEAMKAQGGEAALSKFTGAYFKVKGTEFDGDMKTPVAFEWFFDGRDKMRTVIHDENGKTDEIEVVNGKEGWSKHSENATEPLTEDRLKENLEMCYLNWATNLFPLKSADFRLSVVGESDVAGRKAVGILVKHDKHDPLTLYFDKQNHLLVKYQRRLKSAEAPQVVNEETLFSDYKDVQETKQAFKVEVFWDDHRVSDLAITELKLFEKPMDEKLFEKP